ncbi:hypothetical protein M513_06143 [Trichuris suis]|uniref:Uncharacterized protein n=1 Tax=Trichuris suis TaxID=68888 RepID=A0A085M731_9BILA|nr:hypothetical protein M513_06143 [Trichuris suis]
MTRNNEVVAVSQSHIWSLRIGSEPDNPHLHMKESGIDVDLNSMVKNKCKAIEDDSDKNVTTGDAQSPGPSTAEDRIPSQSEPALEQQPVTLRRSTRMRRPPDRLDL